MKYLRDASLRKFFAEPKVFVRCYWVFSILPLETSGDLHAQAVIIGFVAASFVGLAAPVIAEETTVIRRDGPAVVDHRDTAVERREVTTGTVDCGSKTVHKEDGMGNSKTVHKEGCN